MVIVMEHNATSEQVEHVVDKLVANGFDVHRSTGVDYTVLGAVGAKIANTRDYEAMSGVREVHRISEPYKLASRAFHPRGSRVRVGDVEFGGEEVVIMAGPCTIESVDQCEEVAAAVKDAGARVMRGGAFKPRTSPYSFQGHGEKGLRIIRKAADRHGLVVISEVMESAQIPLAHDYIDIIQIGTRNMQNYNLLRDIGKSGIPALLKRGMSATITDLLLAAEYIMAEGNHNVLLCERGIRTFENLTRNTLDLSAVPVVKQISHLPIVVDPSHAVGIRNRVAPLARAAVAVGADGLLIEVHQDPENALCDGAQSLYMSQFGSLMDDMRRIAQAVGKNIAEPTLV
jgi:3-deoxy-7-phosphoheptulonate synthase